MIKTKNPIFGFNGTVKGNYRLGDKTTSKAYHLMATLLMANFGLNEGKAIAFLDSRCARHLADTMSNFYATNVLEAISNMFSFQIEHIEASVNWFDRG